MKIGWKRNLGLKKIKTVEEKNLENKPLEKLWTDEKLEKKEPIKKNNYKKKKNLKKFWKKKTQLKKHILKNFWRKKLRKKCQKQGNEERTHNVDWKTKKSKNILTEKQEKHLLEEMKKTSTWEQKKTWNLFLKKKKKNLLLKKIIWRTKPVEQKGRLKKKKKPCKEKMKRKTYWKRSW